MHDHFTVLDIPETSRPLPQWVKPRMQFQIRWMMVAVAILALILSLPTPAVLLVTLPMLVPVLILLPTTVVPRSRRLPKPPIGPWLSTRCCSTPG